MNIPEKCLAELEAARAELTAELAGRHCGFKIGKSFSELTTPEEIKAACADTKIECYHCGFEIPDTRDMRRALNDSFEQEFQIESGHHSAPPAGRGDSSVAGVGEPAGASGGRTARFTPQDYSVGFWQPDPASMFVPWRETMESYITAKKSNEELGNIVPMRDFYLARWATAWSDGMTFTRGSERPGAAIYEIDPAKKMPGELARISATDIQFKLTHMVYLAVAVGDGTPPWVLHFEWIKPPTGLTDVAAAEFCKARVRELDKKFGIQQQNSMKDAAHEPGLVREWAAEDASWGRLSLRERPHWIAFGLLIGDDRMSYLWKHPGRKDTWERFKQFHWHKVDAIKDGRRVKVDVHHRLWSNPSIKEIAERWRDGSGAPKLQIHGQWLADQTKNGLWPMLTSEQKVPWKNHPGKLHYNNQGRPNHAWDCWCMIVVRMDELGYLNSFGPPPEDAEPEEN